MPQLLERPLAPPDDFPTGAASPAELLRQFDNSILTELDPSLVDPSTEILTGPQRVKLPPAALDIYSVHDLAAEAEAAAPLLREAEEGEEVFILPPTMSAADAITVSKALNNTRNAEVLTRKYGEEVVAKTYEKAAAITDINIAQAYPSEHDAFRDYAELRQGRLPNTLVSPLITKAIKITVPDPTPEDPEKTKELVLRKGSDLEAFLEPPAHEVPEEPLAFDVKESEVVLEALRLATLRPVRKGDDLRAKDVLSRIDPSPARRKWYAKMLKKAGVHLDVAESKLPEYKQAA